MLYLAQVFVFQGFLKTSHSALNGQVIRGRIFQRHNPQSSIENCLKSTKNSPNTSFSNVFVLPTTVRWFLYRKYTFVHLTLSILNFLIQIIILRKWFRTKQRNPNMTTEKGAYLFLVTKRWQQDNRDTQPNPIPATYSTWDGVFGLFFMFVCICRWGGHIKLSPVPGVVLSRGAENARQTILVSASHVQFN